ncbi:hypothetical protein INR75_19260 [Zunongwangia sp. SCSIO 43204]|uniref:FKBP-type peptidyl-prolyl cis-trans isomerase n=1 Tax=Zunongwangia sp. SCSIO 43204 TaxID=2779359 RepID=UPI001CA9736C|nr:hypothetical protein [Zunongwangia sp. SCSIO 43204]UAB84271.1 hypothetical protein INR75_19260 [Zunongwangia sp. SCSIO 43204]
MRLNKYFLAGIALTGLIFTSCDDDDDGTVDPIELRDEQEQRTADDDSLVEYLQTHFYNYEEFENPAADFDYNIVFDTIAGENSDKVSIWESPNFSTKTVTYQANETELDYNLYLLEVREGAGEQPHFSDSTYVRYKGELINAEVFDNSINSPVWFDLEGFVGIQSDGSLVRRGGVVEAFQQALIEFRGASNYSVNPDNTVEWSNDYGIGALFAPSGLGYFNGTSPGYGYSPLIFTFHLLNVNEADHDGDGIPSWMEDIDGDGSLFDDDSDGDGLPDHSDTDDDGDGLPTRQEIIINADGSLTFPDTNNNGTPNYLDADSFEPVEE